MSEAPRKRANAAPGAANRDGAPIGAPADKALATMRAATLAHLKPPPRLRLADWIEANIYLPSDVSATPGRMRLYSYQSGICAAVDDPAITRLTFVKPVRIGATALLTGIAANFVANDPCPVLILQPTDDDCKDYMVGTVDSTFAASPALRTLITRDDRKADRQIRVRRFPGGSLKCVAAASPRNLRRHTVRVLLMDESSAYEGSPEGSPIALAIKRTLSYPNRLIWESSTPTDEHCNVLKSYAESDRRVFELKCPQCSEWFEPKFREHLRWDKTESGEHLPDTSHLVCAACGGVIEETLKPALVEAGRWRATAPHVKGHAGFRCSAIISTLANCSWSQIVREFLAAKDDPSQLRVWANTICGEAFEDRAGIRLDENALAARAKNEKWGLQSVPEDVRLLVAGVDVQAWGFEVLSVGFSETQTFVLDYRTLHGDPHGDEVWQDLDGFIKQRFAHPLGGALRFDSVAVDSGDGNLTAKVYSFTRPRYGRRVISTKGYAGKRVLIKKGDKPGLYVLGADTGKTRVHDLLGAKEKIRFSADLELHFYEELAAERKVVDHKDGEPKVRWVKDTGARNEALDCLVMAIAARSLLAVDMTARANELRQIAAAPVMPARILSKYVEGNRG